MATMLSILSLRILCPFHVYAWCHFYIVAAGSVVLYRGKLLFDYICIGELDNCYRKTFTMITSLSYTYLDFHISAFGSWDSTGNISELLLHVLSFTAQAIIYKCAVIFSAFVTFKDIFDLITFHYIWK